MKLLDKIIGHGQRVFVTAELGINHNGSIDLAKLLIRAAAEAGADAVKFQTRHLPSTYPAPELAAVRKVDRSILEHGIARRVLSDEAVTRLRESNFANATNGDLKTCLEFTLPECMDLKTCAENEGLIWYSSPWDLPSVAFLENVGVTCYKVAGARVRHLKLLEAIAKTGKPVFLSTGMSSQDEIVKAVEILGTKNLVLMHCRSVYPAKPEILNLRAMKTLREAIWDVVGYSGHEIGIDTTIAAVALGAVAVERHLTLDREMPGSDHKASIGPSEFTAMVDGIREVEQAFGTGEIGLIDAEKPARDKLDKTADIGEESENAH